ncbi:hypothetical protein AB9K34_17760 [Sedimentitalea sp. XS_ASV28]
MNTPKKTPNPTAREALEILEQAFAYYFPEPALMDEETGRVEYFEYAPAA